MKLLTVLLCCSSMTVFAQNKISITSVLEPGKKHDSKEVTIQKCLNDLNSESDETRKKAVLILGKYDGLIVDQALIKGMNDKSTIVRSTALVSTLENPIIQQNMTLPIVERLGDSDLHIRRIASSALPQLAMHLNKYNAQPFPPKALKAIIHAFNDEDPSVRMNMVRSYYRCFDKVSPNLLTPALAGQNDDIKLIALQKVFAYRKEALLDKYLPELVNDENVLLRQTVAKGLRYTANTPQKVAAVEKLMQDKNLIVSAYAMHGMLQKKNKLDISAVMKVLKSTDVDAQTGQQIINLIPNATGDKAAAVKELMKHDRAEYRSTALRISAQIKDASLTPKEIFSLLQDPSMQVRRSAGNMLMRIGFKDTAKLMELTMSPHSDVRETLITLSRRITGADAETLLTDLLLDEADFIRLKVMDELARRKVDGWIQIMLQSLEDPSVKIQEKAILNMVNVKSEEVVKALAKYRSTTKNQGLAARIDVALKKSKTTKKIK